MTETHKIGTIAYEIKFHSEQQAYDFQSKATRFVKSGLVPVIDEVLNQFDPKNQIIYIDKLELDLGTVEYNNEEKIKNRLREELTQLLREKISSIQNHPNEKEKIITKEKSDYQHLLHFLETGNLTWNNPFNSFPALEKIFRWALVHNRKNFVEWLKCSGKNKNIQLRIINQFNDPEIQQVVKAVDSENAPFIIAYSSDLRQAHHEKPLVPLTETEFRHATWEIIFSYLLSDRGSRFNKKSFVEYTVRQLAQSQNIAYTALLQALARSLTILLKKIAFKTEFPSILSELTEENKSAQNDSEKKQQAENEKALALATLQAILQGEEKNFNLNELKKQVQKYPSEIVALLLHHIARENTRKTIVDIFSEEQVRWLIQVLEPLQCEFIFQFAQHLDHSYKRHQPNTSLQNFRKVKWQVILTTLYEERGSRFNRKAFIKSSLAHLSRQYNISYTVLVGNLLSSINQTDKNLTPSFGILNEALHELMQEAQREEAKRLRPSTSVSAYLQACDIYEELLFYLENGFTSVNIQIKYGVHQVSSLLLKLKKISPERTGDFLLQIKKSAIQKQLIKNTDQDFILAIVRLILLIDNQAQEEDAQEFILTMKKYARSVINPSEYYSAVLRLISRQQPIDLDQISTTINRNWDELIRVRPHQPLPFTLMKQHLIDLLLNGNGSSMCTLNYTETWNYILTYYPNNVYSLVRYLINQPTLAVSFIEKTSDKLLLEIIKSTYPSDFTFRVMQHLLSTGLPSAGQSSSTRQILLRQIVTELIFTPNASDADQQIKTILLQVLNSLPTLAAKKQALQNLLSGLTSTPAASEKQKLEAIIASVAENLSPTSPIDEKAELEKQALLLLDGIGNNNRNKTIVLETLIRLMKEKPAKLTELLLLKIQSPQGRKFWIENLPEYILRRIIYLIYPSHFIQIQSTLNILWKNFESCVYKLGYTVSTKEKWQYLLEILTHTLPGTSAEKITYAFVGQLSSSIPTYNEIRLLDLLCQELKANLQPVKKELYQSIIAQVQSASLKIKKTTRQQETTTMPQGNKQQPDTDNKEEAVETIYIHNAGLVLAAPYLPQLFSKLKLTENGTFKSRQTAERAIHLLQYMVNGQTDLPEFQLLLNKILCGITTGIPIIRSIEPLPVEQEIIHQLLQSLIQNWGAIGKTSVKGLQESFLQREGTLKLNNGQWNLLVESRAYDMLLDRLPWNFHTIKYSWMDKLLYVQWR